MGKEGPHLEKNKRIDDNYDFFNFIYDEAVNLPHQLLWLNISVSYVECVLYSKFILNHSIKLLLFQLESWASQ